MSNYTQRIEDAYWGYLERTTSSSKNKIENIPETASAEDWKQTLTSISTEYTCSARFFLTKYLYEKAEKISFSDNTFSFTHKKKTYHFHHVNSEYAKTLPNDERDDYIELFSQISADNHNDKINVWRPLFRKAMLKNRKRELLTREEGFQIAHGLQFNLNLTEEFLLRVLDNDGFCYTRSDDLIEAFCFLYHPANNVHTARMLKNLYKEKASSIPKTETKQKSDHFTCQILFSLQSKLKEWQKYTDLDIIEQFMNWLITQAPSLDVPGKTAWSLYRKLALFAYHQTQKLLNENIFMDSYDRSIIDNSRDFSDIIRNICHQKESFPCEKIFSNQKVLSEQEFFSEQKPDIYTLTSTLLEYSANEFDNIRKRHPTQTWRYLTIHPETGTLTAEAIGQKIPLLLNGSAPVTKADLLFLLWYVCDILWTPLDANTSPELLYDRIAGFWTLAEELLEESCLPPFYIPHLLERSFLNAIICADNFTEDSPFEIYENFCETILPEKHTRNRVRTADSSQTKEERNKLKKLTEKEFKDGVIDFENIETLLAEHFLHNPAKDGQYLFTTEGVIYISDSKAAIQNPNQKLLFAYPDKKTGQRFNMSSEHYNSDDSMRERFRFIYGLVLYMKKMAADQNMKKDFRINYHKNVSLTVIK